jgi:ABC-2 type transport system ATP-binding protein
LVRKFNGFTAVDGISLEIERGELFGLLGPNGAGKSTLTKIISCQIRPTSGSVKVNGISVTERPSDVKKILGVCPQENVLYDYLTARENLYFFGSLYRVPRRELKARVEELLEFTQLAERADVKVSTYSGGMKRRLNMAASLVHNPHILLLDEPTTGLDPQSRRAFWDMISRLKGEGKTTVLTTHLMDEADALSDRVAVMDHGKVIALDTPKALKETIGEEEVVELICDYDSSFVSALRKLRNVSDVAEGRDPKEDVRFLRLFTKDADTALPDIVAVSARHKIRVASLRVTEVTLEDVFIKLTGRSLRE